MRLVNRLLALIVSLALVAGAVVIVVDVVAVLTGHRPIAVDWLAVYRWGSHMTWASGEVRLICVLLAVVGLALLGMELKPRRPARLRTDSDNPATDAAYTRRCVRQTVRDAVTDVDGVDDADVTIRRRHLRVHAKSIAREAVPAASLRDSVTQAARSRLDALQLHRPPKVTVRISAKAH
ncbi:DUF6286 domain-containing protein [Dactylosporangium sp. CA-139114]|uniref:DUF6286 domain-containing protein n=1 Tax=Dactylosporangium sp. CA-139114 TaxID=3239931 RepID=UPI003D96B783